MGSYVESVISSGEEIKYEAAISAWSVLPMLIIGIITIPVLGLGILIIINALILYFTTELVVTDKKIIAKFGLIGRKTIEMLLDKVESIQVNQSVIGRIFNYGSIIVSGAGNPQAPVPGIANPLMFRRKFMEIQESTKK